MSRRFVLWSNAALSGCLTAGLLMAGATSALAQPEPMPVPLPKLELDQFEKLEKLGKLGKGDFKFDEKWQKDLELKLEDAREAIAKIKPLPFDFHYDFQFEKPFGMMVPKLQGAQIARVFERCDNWRGDAREAEERYYDCGRRAADESQWDRAIDYFGRAAAAKGARADAALYWKAWSQDRLGQRAEALATIAELKSAHAKSRWIDDANRLEIEVRQKAGQKVDPSSTMDDEVKIVAVNALGDSPEGVPVLERLIQGPQSPKLKARALFVLANNQSPAARAVVVKVAKGGANPELQLKAVEYLGQIRSPETREVLGQVYTSTPDAAIKRAILRAYTHSQDRERLLAAARAETDQSLRLEAVRQLGHMQAGAELADLYAREASPDVKKQILRGLGESGQIDRLAALAQSEQDPELKRTAVRTLGFKRSPETTALLVDIYTKNTEPRVREAAISALNDQGNATVLIGLARKEKDPEMRKLLVRRLSEMRDNKEAMDYMLEVLR